MNIVAIVQARMGSTRLPGKVLRPLAGKPMVQRVLERVTCSKNITSTIIATTASVQDDPLADFCSEHGWQVFRGSEPDVLDRYYRAAVTYAADVVVRITADCPLIDSSIIDDVVQAFQRRQPQVSYASNVVPVRTFPHGLDVEAFSFRALETAWKEDDNPCWREHVTPFLYRRPDRFATYCLENDTDLSDYRLTVDTIEDFELVSRIYNELDNAYFNWREVITLLDLHPQWLRINEHVVQKEI